MDDALPRDRNDGLQLHSNQDAKNVGKLCSLSAMRGKNHVLLLFSLDDDIGICDHPERSMSPVFRLPVPLSLRPTVDQDQEAQGLEDRPAEQDLWRIRQIRLGRLGICSHVSVLF